MSRRLWSVAPGESHGPLPFFKPTTEHFHQQKERRGPHEVGPCNTMASVYNSSSPKDLIAIYSMHWRWEYMALLKTVRYRV